MQNIDPIVRLGENVELLCPSCGFNYLHHETVDIFSRTNGEDGDGLRYRVDGIHMRVDDVKEGEIPGRRNAIEIAFYCENCCLDKNGKAVIFYVLQILQHKGCTYFEWVRTVQK